MAAKQGISTSLGSVLIHGYTAAGVFYEPYLTETYDEATNQSTLSIAHRIRIMEEWGGRYEIPNSTPIYITVDGTTTTFTPGNYGTVYPTNQAVTVATTTQTVTHNSDGTKTISISCRWNNSSAQYQGATASKSVTLTTIPRASSMSFTTSQTMGTAYTFTISRASSGFTHTITWSYGGSSGTAVSSTSSTTPSFTPAIATFAPLCTNATSATITYTLNTYSGSTLIGSKSYTATLAVPSSVVPSVSLAVSAVNPFNSLYLQGKSSVKLTATGSVSSDYSATIRSYSFQVLNSASTAVSSGSSSTSSTSATHTSGVLTGSGTHTCKVTITDSRGRTATATKTITVTAYSKPVWGTTSAYRCDSNGDVAEEGTYIALTAMAQYSAVSGNSIALTYQTKESTASSWSSATSYTNGQKTIIGSSYDITKAYNVKVTATDTVGNTITTTLYVSTSAVGIDYDPTNNTLGLLRYAPSGSSDAVYMPKGYAFGPDGASFSQLLTLDFMGEGKRAPISLPYITYNDTGTGSGGGEVFCKDWLKYLVAHYADMIAEARDSVGGGQMTPLIGLMCPNSYAHVYGFMYSATDLVNDLPRYSAFAMLNLGGTIHRFGTTSGNWWFRTDSGIGSRYDTRPSAVACANATITKVATLTIPAGTWWYRGVGNWSTNATGFRTISFENSIGGSRDLADTTCGTTGTSTFQSFSHTATYSASTTLNLYAWQNSGGNLNVWPYIEAIRLA